MQAAFLAFLIKREDMDQAFSRAPDGRIGFARWWIHRLPSARAGLLMATASLTPVAFGHALGAPAVVFIGLGLIIPPMIIAIQTGSGLRLPVLASMLLAAAVFSLWMDNPTPSAAARSDACHGTAARRPRASRWLTPMPSGERSSQIPEAAHPPNRAGRLGRWCVARRRLDRRGFGRVAPAKARRQARLQPVRDQFGLGRKCRRGRLLRPSHRSIRLSPPNQVTQALPHFTGQDALSPTLTGMLFPDLLQRFLPVAFLPDRAEALERAWETRLE